MVRPLVAPSRGITSSRIFVKPAANVPNIVAICADDMPYWMLSIAMPKTLARLRDEGVRFTNAYCSVPLCGPDRATMFSGRYVHSHDCKTNNGCAGAFRNKGWEADSLAVRMARAGYVTGLLGKYINDYGAAFAPEIPQGYNRFVGYSGEEIQSKDEFELSVDGRTKVYRIADVGETELLADKSELFLRNRNNEMPYFLWLAPTAPHAPYTPTPANANKFSDWQIRQEANWNHLDTNKPASVSKQIDPATGLLVDKKALTEEEKADILEGQIGKLRELADLDDLLDHVCSIVTELGRWRDTIVMFFSDNGFHFGEHRIEKGKDEPYEESVRTPLLVRGAGIQQNVSNSSLVGTVDIPRTIAGLGGADTTGMEGRDLSPILYGTASSVRSRMLFENPKEFWVGVREGNWKYVARYADEAQYLGAGDPAERELYDLSTDQFETTTVHHLAGNSATVAAMQGHVNALKACTGAGCRTADA